MSVGSGRRTSGRHRKKPDALARAVGVRIAGLRKEQGFTFDAFVEECGLGRGYISELERGLVVPSVLALAKIAAALGLSMVDLVAIGTSPREQLVEAVRRLREDDVADLVAQAERLSRNE